MKQPVTLEPAFRERVKGWNMGLEGKRIGPRGTPRFHTSGDGIDIIIPKIPFGTRFDGSISYTTRTEPERERRSQLYIRGGEPETVRRVAKLFAETHNRYDLLIIDFQHDADMTLLPLGDIGEVTPPTSAVRRYTVRPSHNP